MSVRCRVIEKAFFNNRRVYPGEEVELTDREAAKLGASSPFQPIGGRTRAAKRTSTKKKAANTAK